MNSAINTIIFSANRACQLELLLRSINVPAIVFYHFDPGFEAGYKKLMEMYPNFEYIKQTDFKKQLASLVGRTDFTSFLCDDDVMVEPYDQNSKEINEFKNDPEVVSFSLGLSGNVAGKKWNWKEYQGNRALRMWGYPRSVDSCIFKTYDILPIIKNNDFPSLNLLEVAFYNNPPTIPKMMCFDSRKIVNYAVNSVQKDFKRHSIGPSVKELEKRFLNGERISLEDVKQKTKNSPLYRVRKNFAYETY